MTPEENTQVADAVERAKRWVNFTEQRRIETGERTTDEVLTREWRRASRVMRDALGRTDNAVAANSAVTQYMDVYNALVIVRRDLGRKAPANHASSRTGR